MSPRSDFTTREVSFCKLGPSITCSVPLGLRGILIGEKLPESEPRAVSLLGEAWPFGGFSSFSVS
eukprot:TRINITY_DN1983_c0_g1_i1.p2 TRINITY_DN1983_c0_g1~~TRINITY_DN1983_c0_g1_i1.p2  ORF type:complete len:65 (+),score=3.15 TRINITY_DN1983_c0_g1_i1:272-466(+)